jgi:hypothetical protein
MIEIFQIFKRKIKRRSIIRNIHMGSPNVWNSLPLPFWITLLKRHSNYLSFIL